MNSGMEKIIFIPMEIKSRELDSRLLLALELVSRKFKVFLGEKIKVNQLIKEYTGAVYFAKSGAKIDKEFFMELKLSEHKIVVLDEEAIIHQNEKAHVKSRLNGDSIALADRFFSWGEYDNSVALKAYPEYREKFLITGNPRMDLLRIDMRQFYEKTTTQINEQFGKYIFIPSSFAMCNHYTESGARIEWRKRLGMISSQEDEEFYQAYVDHFEKIFRAFLKVIPKLAKVYKKYLFIVRPHPSENRSVWEQSFKEIPNIKVITKGPIAPWLLASEMVIHNGCTTAIETFLLDKPVISYRPFISDKYDLDVPNSISLEAFNYEELEILISRLLSEGAPEEYTRKAKQILSQYIYSMEGKFAFEKIADSISKLQLDSKQKLTLKTLIKKGKRIQDKYGFSKNRTNYSKQKFPRLTLEELNSLINQYTDIHFRGISICNHEVSKNVFSLTTKEK